MLDLTAQCWDDPQPKLIRRQELSRASSGIPTLAELGPPIWRVDLVSKPIASIEADQLYADLLSAENSTVLIRPRAFRFIDGYAGILPSVTVATVSGNKVTLNGLPGGVVVLQTVYFINPQLAQYAL